MDLHTTLGYFQIGELSYDEAMADLQELGYSQEAADDILMDIAYGD